MKIGEKKIVFERRLFLDTEDNEYSKVAEYDLI